MHITEERFYNGSQEKIGRLNIGLYHEVKALLLSVPLALLEEREANSGAVIREKIDSAFDAVGGWTKTTVGGIDWKKCTKIDGAEICLGVEVQVSIRSDLVVIDIDHLRTAIEEGAIDLGVIVVPSDRMASFLGSRAPSYGETVYAVEKRMRADNLPLVVLAVEHDGPGEVLPKKKKKH